MLRLPAVLVLFVSIPLAAFGQAPLAPAETKAAFLKLLGRSKVPADVKETPTPTPSTEDGALVTSRFSFASEKKADGAIERVPAIAVSRFRSLNDAGPKPVVVVLHGTGGNKEQMTPWLNEFANQGYLAVAIDARYHGERVPGVKGSTAYVDAITKAWRTPAGQPQEHPLYYDTAWDLWRLLDYLETRADVDKTRIGMVGESMGGIQTWLAASVDDRVKVACPLIAAQSLKWSLENDRWQGRAKTFWATHEAAAKDLGESEVNAKVCKALWGKVVPGLTGEFDCPNMLPLFAGRRLFLANGELDPNCPLPGAKLAFASAEKAFAAAGASDSLEIHVAAGVAHRVTPDQRAAVFAFCKKWLKP